MSTYRELVESLWNLSKISNKHFLTEVWFAEAISTGEDLWLFVRPSLENYEVQPDNRPEEYVLSSRFRESFNDRYSAQCEIDYPLVVTPVVIVKARGERIQSALEQMEADSSIINIEFSRPTFLLRQSSFPCIEVDPGRLYLQNRSRLSAAKNVVIGMVDSGIDANHDEFRHGNIEKDTVFPNDNGYDNQGHGTAVASIMIGNPGIIPEATLYSVKAFNHVSSYISSIKGAVDVLVAIEKCLKRGVTVINVSMGHTPCYGNPPCELCNIAVQANKYNCIVVAASGDTRKHPQILCPAQSSSAIAVNAFDAPKWTKWPYNPIGPALNGNQKPDLMAPGVDINTAYPGNQAAQNTGTSFAAPHVSGVLALLLCKYHPTQLTNGIQALERNAYVYHHWARPREQGNGIIKLERALQYY